MAKGWSAAIFRTARVLAVAGLLVGKSFPQKASITSFNDCLVAQPTTSVATASVPAGRNHEEQGHQRFWDKKSRVLFASVAALNAADFAATRANLQNGG